MFYKGAKLVDAGASIDVFCWLVTVDSDMWCCIGDLCTWMVMLVPWMCASGIMYVIQCLFSM